MAIYSVSVSCEIVVEAEDIPEAIAKAMLRDAIGVKLGEEALAVSYAVEDSGVTHAIQSSRDQ